MVSFISNQKIRLVDWFNLMTVFSLEVISKIDQFVGRIEYVVIALLSALIALILITQVILRYLFSSPLFWAEEISVQMLVLLSFWGASYALQKGEVIKVDLMSLCISGRFKNIVELVLKAISFLVIAGLCYFSTEWILRPEVHAEMSPTTDLPKWYNYSMMIVALYFMAWHILASMFTASRKS